MHADTLIVGAGAAGAVIASRMSERSDHDVLIVEAGPDYPGDLPDDLRDGTRNSMTRHDWGYRHRPTPSVGSFDYPRGRVVGGSTAVNTCIALRGQPYDYDEWDLLLGAVEATWIVIESDREVGVDDRWEVVRTRRYGSTVVTVARAE